MRMMAQGSSFVAPSRLGLIFLNGSYQDLRRSIVGSSDNHETSHTSCGDVDADWWWWYETEATPRLSNGARQTGAVLVY